MALTAVDLVDISTRDLEKIIGGLDPDAAEALLWDWGFWGRSEQQIPCDEWSIWLALAGRGWGKTRTGAEWTREQIKKGVMRIGLIAPTAADARDVMVEGQSGILGVCWEHDRTHAGVLIGIPDYEPSKRRLTWANGAIATLYSAEKPGRLRGPQHEKIWADEIAVWERMRETYDMAELGLRLGDDPQMMITTTPKPRALLREIAAEETTIITGGSTYENRANLAAKFFHKIIRKYEGTALGRQEIHAQMLDEAEGALWQRDWFDRGRVNKSQMPELRRSAIAIDPAASNTESSSETGIIFGGVGTDNRGYVVEDLSGHYSPDGWARAAILCYFRNHANYIVVERNNGGEMVEATIKLTATAMKAEKIITTDQVPVVTVWASQGKYARAEPVSGLYEQGKISHVHHGKVDPSELGPDQVAAHFDLTVLEDQCCTWEPNGKFRSPDRLDAVVWLWTDLMVEPAPTMTASPEVLEQTSYWRDS